MDYNTQQVEMMKKQLSSFIQGETGLGDLITELECLLGEMKNPNPAWQKSCFEKVGNLTSIYASTLKSEGAHLEEKREELLVQNIYELIKLANKNFEC